jgi:ADP-heptose:LPS heptosyltransferase
VLDACVAGEPPKELPRTLVEEACGAALFGILAEGLADRFEPALCDAYVHLFSQAVSFVRNSHAPPTLTARYERVRRSRPIAGRPHRIFVLSRVTLGADVAVTSVLLHAARRRFPHAELFFAGPRKNHELFAGDSHIRHAPVEYRRGSLRERLAAWDDLTALAAGPDTLVIDPDSRLTQLGLLPVCDEDRYHLFESRSYGGDSERTLPDLASEWAAETFGIKGSKPFVSLPRVPQRGEHIAVSLGVGDNPSKRLPDPFEVELLRLLAATGRGICIDMGAGGEEAARVSRVLEVSGVRASTWQGSFAGFASIIAAGALYVGYDSAGQHVAAACGIPLISIFGGFPVPRMFHRWRPAGSRATVIRFEQPDVADALARVTAALGAL